MRIKLAALVTGVFITTCLFIPATPSPTLAQIKLNYSAGPPAPTFPCVQMERWKKEVEKRTGGKVLINTYPGGTLLKDKTMIDGVTKGQSDIGVLCMAYQPGRFPVTNATSLPLGLPDARVGSLVLLDLYEKYKPEEFSGVKVLTMFTCAPSNIMSKVPVKSLADLKNLSLRASGAAALVLQAWGANAVGMPMPETPEALQKGVVKGLFSSLEVLKDFKFAESCRYATITNTVVYPFSAVMNMNSWNKLPKDVQKVMDDMAREQSEWTGTYMDNQVKESIAWSKKTYNVEFIELPKAEMEELDAFLEPIVKEWIKENQAKGIPAEAIIADIKAFTKKYSGK